MMRHAANYCATLTDVFLYKALITCNAIKLRAEGVCLSSHIPQRVLYFQINISQMQRLKTV